MPVLDTRQGNGLIGKFIGDIVLQILSFVAETERRKIKERQAQGIAAAKARGVKFGRREVPVPEDMERLVNLFANRELSLTEAAAEANMNRSTFYRNAIRMGVNCYLGKLTNKNVADAHGYKYVDLKELVV